MELGASVGRGRGGHEVAADARLVGLHDHVLREVLLVALSVVDELTQLIGDLTELARQEAPEVQQEPLDLAEVVERAVDRVRRRASTLRFDVDVQPWGNFVHFRDSDGNSWALQAIPSRPNG